MRICSDTLDIFFWNAPHYPPLHSQLDLVLASRRQFVCVRLLVAVFSNGNCRSFASGGSFDDRRDASGLRCGCCHVFFQFPDRSHLSRSSPQTRGSLGQKVSSLYHHDGARCLSPGALAGWPSTRWGLPQRSWSSWIVSSCPVGYFDEELTFLVSICAHLVASLPTARLAVVVMAPGVGLEPATLRLTVPTEVAGRG